MRKLTTLLCLIPTLVLAQGGPLVPVPPPTISSICATQGTTAGGTAVVINGTGFNNVRQVSFGGAPAGTGWWASNDTTLTVSSPPNSAGTVDILLSGTTGTSAPVAADQFTYVTPSAIPTVTSITPNSDIAAGGDTISVSGTNINNVTQACFGTTCINIFPSASNTNGFAFAIPAGTGTQHVTLKTATQQSVATCVDQFTYTSTTPTPAPIPPTATRPYYNYGNGFFVKGRGIYDANGNLFTPVGANWSHFDWTENNRFATGLSAERNEPFFRSTDTFHTSAQEGIMTNEISNFVVPIATIFNTNYDGTSCPPSTDPNCAVAGQTLIAVLNQAIAFFTTNGSTGTGPNNWANTVFSGTSFTGNQIAWFDPANEWGPCTSDSAASNYRTGWVSGVQAMRTAGYTAPIVVDAGCFGQGPDVLVQDAVAIEAADPLHNVIFAIHLYGSFYDSAGTPPCGGCGFLFTPMMASLAQLTVPVIIEEFGCANCQANVAPGTPVTSDKIMQTGIQYGFGYLAWAWDDNNGGYYCNGGAIGPPCNALQMLGTNSVSSPSQACYKNAAGTDVTGTAAGTNIGGTFGHDVITFPTYGILAAAKVASVFTGTRPAPGTCPF